MRGEYVSGALQEILQSELPPRARRIRSVPVRGSVILGTTSACAENTFDGLLGVGGDGNYLRVRGEYALDYLHGLLRTELPPRARRILDRETIDYRP